MNEQLESCIVEDYRRGMSLSSVASAHGTSTTEVVNLLRQAGDLPRSRGSRGQGRKVVSSVRTIVVLFDQGRTIHEIAKDIGFSDVTVSHVLRSCNRRPRSGPRSKTYRIVNEQREHLCARCKKWLPCDLFGIVKGGSRHSYCRQCNSKAAMAWAAAKKIKENR